MMTECIRARVLTLVLVCLMLVPLQVAAHPPSGLVPEYNGTTGQLSLTITHEVGTQTKHYINRILIQTPGGEKEYLYASQPSDTFTTSYPLDAVPGEQVTCTAYCSIAGSKTTDFVYAIGPDMTGETPLPAGNPVPPPPALPPLWLVHAALIATGFSLMLLSAVIVTWFRRGSWWYKAHIYLAPAGGLLAIAGLLTAVYMVAQSGGPHFRVLHGWIGALATGLILTTIVLGAYRRHARPERKVLVRDIHLGLGWATLAVMAINILFGLRLTGFI